MADHVSKRSRTLSHDNEDEVAQNAVVNSLVTSNHIIVKTNFSFFKRAPKLRSSISPEVMRAERSQK